MQATHSETLGAGITCIDAGYVRPGLASFYLLQEAGECAIIETGTTHSLPHLHTVLDQCGLAAQQVRYIIPTHVHLDHAGGVGSMMRAFPEAQLLIHPRGARHMADPARLVGSAKEVYGESAFAALYGEVVPVDAARIREIGDGERIDIAGRPLEFRHTEGHARHHFCIWDERSAGWFSGDMFGVSYPWLRFPGGDFVLPSTTPTQFDPEAFIASLELLRSYRPERFYLTHFGELPYSAWAQELLARQVLAYRDLAVQYAGDAAALEAAISEFSLALLRQLDPHTPESQQREWLAFDARLNAQGLQIWEQGRST